MLELIVEMTIGFRRISGFCMTKTRTEKIHSLAVSVKGMILYDAMFCGLDGIVFEFGFYPEF